MVPCDDAWRPPASGCGSSLGVLRQAAPRLLLPADGGWRRCSLAPFTPPASQHQRPNGVAFSGKRLLNGCRGAACTCARAQRVDELPCCNHSQPTAHFPSLPVKYQVPLLPFGGYQISPALMFVCCINPQAGPKHGCWMKHTLGVAASNRQHRSRLLQVCERLEPFASEPPNEMERSRFKAKLGKGEG